MTEGARRLSLELDPVPTAPAVARRFVRTALHSWGASEETVGDVMLIATELVTNSVLHANTPLRVEVSTGTGTIGLTVEDRSPILPVPRDYGDEALTGRGLGVVAALAHEWGVRPNPGGKVVWVEIGAGEQTVDRSPSAPLAATDAPLPEEPPPGGPGWAKVRFDAVPVAPYLDLHRHNDELLREFALLAIRLAEVDPEKAALPARLATLIGAIDGRWTGQRDRLREMVEAAAERGQSTVDLVADYHPGAIAAAESYVSLLEEADEFCRSGDLLGTPAPPAVARLRRWFVEEMIRQIAEADVEP